MACFWAVVFALVFRPLYLRVKQRVKGKSNLASILTLSIILLLVILPVALLVVAVVNEAAGFYVKLTSGEFHIGDHIDNLKMRLPVVESLLAKAGIELSQARQGLQSGLTAVTKWMGQNALGLGQNVMGQAAQSALMLYMLFFFFRDGDALVEEVVRVVPMGDSKERELMERFANVARATVRGSLSIAVVQGIIGGVLFWAVGIPGAVLFGALMIVLSLLPVGATLVWLPAGVILLAQGEIVRGVVVLLVGALLIGLMDNLLRPKLVGQDTKMPDYLILLATLSGIAQFGLSGFVLGPVIAALFVTVWKMVGDEFGDDDDAAGVEDAGQGEIDEPPQESLDDEVVEAMGAGDEEVNDEVVTAGDEEVLGDDDADEGEGVEDVLDDDVNSSS